MPVKSIRFKENVHEGIEKRVEESDQFNSYNDLVNKVIRVYLRSGEDLKEVELKQDLERIVEKVENGDYRE